MYRALDIGGNPDISTLDLFKQGLQENQATKGKVQALQQLRSASIPNHQPTNHTMSTVQPISAHAAVIKLLDR